MKLDTKNISIYVQPEIALALELGEFFTVEYPPITRDIPVIIDNSIVKSDIWIYSPDWVSIKG